MTLEGRLALAGRIRGLDYPNYQAAWLKAVPVAWVSTTAEPTDDRAVPTRLTVLQSFVANEFWYWTPEHAPYDLFSASSWHAVSRADMTVRVDEIFGQAAESVPADVEGVMVDHESLDRWFTVELWGTADPTWFVNTGREAANAPAAVGVDDDVLAMLWFY